MKLLFKFTISISITIFITSSLYIISNSTQTIDESDIIFSHQFHVAEQEFECTGCHINIEASTSAADDNLPTMDECGSCHDVEDDETCNLCHRNPDEPMAVTRVEREILFNHQLHLVNNIDCNKCHNNIMLSTSVSGNFLPSMSVCMTCHDGRKADNSCAKCHGSKITLTDIHPGDWRHQHGDRAAFDREWCLGCHTKNDFCLSCHFGDNTSGRIHELNFQFTHGLDAQSKNADCRKCHSQEMFCITCHENGNRMPLAHSTTNWIIRHGNAAKDDVENCAACHTNSDPVCANSGCHNDFDGIKGTNPDIHSSDLSSLEHGPWHSSDSYYCFQCHTNTYTPGIGFCGYCHGGKKD